VHVVPSHCLSCKSSATLSALQTIDCTPADCQMQKSVGQTTNTNRARFHSLFGMKFTQLTCQYSNGIGDVQVRSKVWVCVKVPSCHLSCKSSTTLQLFKQLTALLQTIDCRKVWGKQLTGSEQGSTHCSV
jgi:hypothetical protein